MTKTILVAGFGTGISNSVSERFGREGFGVALVGRNAERVAAGAKALEAKGVRAAGFACDLGDAAAVARTLTEVRSKLGPITVLHWNAYGGAAGDLLKADAAALHGVFDLAVVGLVTTVQQVLPDLKAQADSAVLVTNGGLALSHPDVNRMAVQWGAMGLAVANAAKHRVVDLLSEKLKEEKIYVGEVMVLARVKGTAFDSGDATLEPATVADKFWEMYRARTEISINVP